MGDVFGEYACHGKSIKQKSPKHFLKHVGGQYTTERYALK